MPDDILSGVLDEPQGDILTGVLDPQEDILTGILGPPQQQPAQQPQQPAQPAFTYNSVQSPSHKAQLTALEKVWRSVGQVLAGPPGLLIPQYQSAVEEALVGAHVQGPAQLLEQAGGVAQFAGAIPQSIIGDNPLSRALKTGGEKVSEVGRGLQGLVSEPEPGLDRWARTVGSVVPQMSVQVGAAMATGGASLPAQLAVFAGTAVAPVVGSQYIDAVGAGQSEGDAVIEATAAGLITFVTNLGAGAYLLRTVPGADKAITKAATNVALRVAGGGVAEGVQEASEKVFTDAVAAMLRDDPSVFPAGDLDYWKQVVYEGSVGFLPGAVTRAVVETAPKPPSQKKAETAKPEPEPEEMTLKERTAKIKRLQVQHEALTQRAELSDEQIASGAFSISPDETGRQPETVDEYREMIWKRMEQKRAEMAALGFIDPSWTPGWKADAQAQAAGTETETVQPTQEPTDAVQGQEVVREEKPAPQVRKQAKEGKRVQEAEEVKRTFYRGTVPGETKRVDEPFEAAKGMTFMARTREAARMYGKQIEEITAKPDAKILRQEDPEFWSLIGRRKPPNGSLRSTKGGAIENVNLAITRAKAKGYDAVSFTSDSDIGTVIINESAFIRPTKPQRVQEVAGSQRNIESFDLDDAVVTAEFESAATTEESDDFLYHVTDADSAADIVARGVSTGHEPRIGKDISSAPSSEFFLTEKSGVSAWEQIMLLKADPNQDYSPVVVRIPKSALRDGTLKPDEQGSKDSGVPSFRFVPTKPPAPPAAEQGAATAQAPPTTPPPVVPVQPGEDRPDNSMSARKADIARKRELLDLNKLPSQERQSWQGLLDKAEADPDNSGHARQISVEVNAEYRAFSPEETASVVLEATSVLLEHERLMAKIGKTEDMAELQSLSATAQRVEQDFDMLSTALDLSGTEKGRALNAQKLTLNKDFRLLPVLNRAKASKGKALSRADRLIFENLTKRLEASNERVKQLEQQASVEQANRSLRGRQQRPQSKTDSDLKTLYAKANALLKAGCRNA